MKVVRLTIEHFRGIKQAILNFDGHALLIGMNNVGKSTICEALDLVLGPDRISRFPPVDEFDFYNSQYLAEDGSPIPAKVEVILTEITEDVLTACRLHLEFWNTTTQSLLEPGEVEQANPPDVVPCLRLETIARYNPEEDEFEAETLYSHGTNNADGSPERVNKRVKRLFGFLYLRTLRTGSRALSLERGSLLDIILRMQNIRTGLWEQAIKRLRGLAPPISDGAAALTLVLENIEQRIAHYIPTRGKDRATNLFVSQLTREHLRKTISFFLSMSPDQEPIPFKGAGTGTLNALVLALLTFIAEIKKDNVIFAMEEPEIALPPHTQRKIVNYLLNETAQCFVTSHSPYVIEQFGPRQILILRRNHASATVSATPVSEGSSLNPKLFRRLARRGLAEAMLGPGAIIAEGVSEQSVIRAVAEKVEAESDALMPLDLSGITILAADGDGGVHVLGRFLKELEIRAYGFYDRKTRSEAELQKYRDALDVAKETDFKGMEKLLIAETPLQRQWEYLCALRDAGLQGVLPIPATIPSDEQVRKLAYDALKGGKGDGAGAMLIELCEVSELPPSITSFLSVIYTDFPKPKKVELPESPAVSHQDESPSAPESANVSVHEGEQA